jgi:uracil-DNA glycosylase
MAKRLDSLLREIRRCTVCAAHLPLDPRPILSAHGNACLLIIGQAPGKRAHARGRPWDDVSGDRLREWMGISRQQFYESRKLAIVPMGFCYPGTGKSGDLPPRKECAELWHERILAMMPAIRLTLVLSRYAHSYYLKERQKCSLTKTVEAWKEFRPETLPLPHPSPRNNIWLKKNPWFQAEVVPYLRRRVRALLS